MKTIAVEQINYNHDQLKVYLKDLDAEISYQILTLVYYPYILFEYSLKQKRKGFFRPIGKTAGCTVDGINHLGSLIDRLPRLKEQNISTQRILHRTLDVSVARNIAKNFLYETISSRMKIFSMPQLTLIREEVFYRPYWIAEGLTSTSHQFTLTIDAVSGRYHPL